MEEVAPVMKAVETFHNFTLIHDDIMDDAPMRRGEPTVYKKWGANVGILSGDAMLVEAYRCWSRSARSIWVRSSRSSIRWPMRSVAGSSMISSLRPRRSPR